MTEIDNDKLLRDFFTENRQEIAAVRFLAVLPYYYQI